MKTTITILKSCATQVSRPSTVELPTIEMICRVSVLQYEREGTLIPYAPATPHFNSIKRPACSKCGTELYLFGIEAENPGHELHSFECPKCKNIEVRIAKSERA